MWTILSVLPLGKAIKYELEVPHPCGVLDPNDQVPLMLPFRPNADGSMDLITVRDLFERYKHPEKTNFELDTCTGSIMFLHPDSTPIEGAKPIVFTKTDKHEKMMTIPATNVN